MYCFSYANISLIRTACGEDKGVRIMETDPFVERLNHISGFLDVVEFLEYPPLFRDYSVCMPK